MENFKHLLLFLAIFSTLQISQFPEISAAHADTADDATIAISEYAQITDGACHPLCPRHGMRHIVTSTGPSANLFYEPHSTPSLVVSYDGEQCYAELIPDTGTGINLTHTDGQTYHTNNGTLCDPCTDGKTFCFTPATASSSYSFNISARGEFLIDWGDGTIEKKTKNNTTDTSYGHTYSGAASNYRIVLRGNVTGYADATNNATASAIHFNNDGTQVKAISGCLGCVFKTLDNGKQPIFHSTFLNNEDLTGTLPAGLFVGISGQPVAHQFRRTFEGCPNLTGEIPEKFFHISGTLTERLFSGTFNGAGIDTINANALKGLSGAGALYAFGATFSNLQNLTEIPPELFADITSSAERMFSQTFKGCTGLTTIPAELFEKLTTGASGLFSQTFMGCTGLKKIPPKMFASFTTIGPTMFGETFSECSALTTIGDGMLGDIPAGGWAYDMMINTFNGCSALTGPSATVGTGANKKYWYQMWNSLNSSYTANCYAGATGLDDYDCIPKSWGGGGTSGVNDCQVPETD